MKIDEQIAVMTAYKNGKEIEAIPNNGQDKCWKKVDNINFNWELFTYRVKLQKIKLKGGDWVITTQGDVSKRRPFESIRAFGMEFQTKKLATKASKEMKVTNRLRALAYQIDPDYIVPPTGKDTFFIFAILGSYSEGFSTYNIGVSMLSRDIGTVYMSEQTAIKICELLNNRLFDL